MSGSVVTRDPKPEQMLRLWKYATCDSLIPFPSRRMQMTWSPDQTVRSSRLTRSRNSLFFSSSKVNLIFCFCFLPDEATEGQGQWSGGAAAPSLFYSHRDEKLLKIHCHLLPSLLISSLVCLYLICLPGFPRVALRMMRTPVYLLVILAQVNQAALLAGLATFMAKFIERQFSQTASLSTMMIGERSLPSSAFEFGYRKAEQSDGTETSLLVCLQVEFVSHWQYWAPSWEGLWCEGWTFLWAALASCALAPSLSACSPPCRCCWLAAPPRRLMESFLQGNHTVRSHAPSAQKTEAQTSPPTLNRFHLRYRSDVFVNVL